MKLLSILFIGLITIQLTSAQGFEVSPVVLEYKVEPSNAETKNIMVTNHGNKRQAFSMGLRDFERDSSGAKQYMEAGSSKNSLSRWITVSPSYIEINPNESKDIGITVTVPHRDYSTKWAILTIKAVQVRTSFEADKTVRTGILITPTIAVNIYQSPSSSSNYKAQLSDFKEVTKEGDEYRTMKVIINNTGGKKIDCRLNLIIADVETAKERKMSPKKFYTLPGERRVVTLKLPNDLEPGVYSVAAVLDYGHRTALEGIQTIIEVK
ncbi:MAG: hypothetical protein COA57_04235 [Flavobacteriales bacterium]|nr:MAG: hypothetical protein COA57_04235 [Flavobacteriales bacterium]